MDLLVVCQRMVFGVVVTQILEPGMPFYVEFFLRTTWSVIQKYRISIKRDRWRLTMLLAIPAAVELLQWIGVGGCGYPNSWRIRRMTQPSLVLRKSATSWALAADVATNLRMVLMT